MHARSSLFALLVVALAPTVVHAQEAAAPEAAPAAEAPAADAAPEAAPATDAAATDAPVEGETAEAAPAETGTISVSSTPVGRVFLDGTDTGLSTPIVDLPVGPGTHTLKVVEDGTGRTKEITFQIDAGSVLNLNLNLPEAAPEPVVEEPAATEPAAEPAADPAAAVAPAAPVDDWTWMSVAGWSALGVGTLGILAGAVILTTPTDPEQGPLGFGLFGVGAGLVLGGGVLLYLDSELADSSAPAAPTGDGTGTAQSALGFFRR